MNVSAIIVTRGEVDLNPICDSLPEEWEIVVWDNGRGIVERHHRPGRMVADVASDQPDLAVYGRYAAIEHASGDLIYVQDDDCVLPPESILALVNTWKLLKPPMEPWLVANMPQPFRHDFYSEHCLVGFGAVFHRDLPWMAFEQLTIVEADGFGDFFRRTCDIVFTALTPRVLVDVPYKNLPWAEDESRMYRQNGHVEERTRMLELVRKVRDA